MWIHLVWRKHFANNRLDSRHDERHAILPCTWAPTKEAPISVHPRPTFGCNACATHRCFHRSNSDTSFCIQANNSADHKGPCKRTQPRAHCPVVEPQSQYIRPLCVRCARTVCRWWWSGAQICPNKFSRWRCLFGFVRCDIVALKKYSKNSDVYFFLSCCFANFTLV